MTGGEQPYSDVPLVAFGIVEIAPPRDDVEGWCPDCKAYSVATGDVHLLTPHGVTHLGAWAACEICDEEDIDV